LLNQHSQILSSSNFSQFSWPCNHLPLPLQFPMGSNTKCSSVSEEVTLGTVSSAISTRLLLTRESTPSLMIVNFKEGMKSNHHSTMPLKKMTKLKTLVIENGRFSNGLKYLPSSLIVLKWKGCLSESLSASILNKASEMISFSNCIYL